MGVEAEDPRRLPPQATMGLLDYVTAHAMDEDYAYVSSHRSSGAPRRRIGVAGALALLVFAALVVTAAVQTSRNAGADAAQRRELAARVSDARAAVEADRVTLARLQASTDRLQAQQLEGDASAQGLLQRMEDLGTRTGTAGVQGPGVRVVVDDAPGSDSARTKVLDSDLQRLVNGLWGAGAEAISINGQRLTTLSTIRQAGDAITTNSRSLSRPYVVSAVGNRDTLPARFAETSSGQAWLDLQRELGLELTITPVDSLRLPAAEVALRYANQSSGGTP